MEQIHFLDNFFYLRSFIRLLKGAYSLPIDPDYFAAQVLRDSQFINQMIQEHYEVVKERPNLRRKMEYLQHILRLKRAFIELIHLLFSSEQPLTRNLIENYSAWDDMVETHKRDSDEIVTMLKGADIPDDEKEAMISADEFQFLLTE